MDLQITAGTIRLAAPPDIKQGSGGQFPVSWAARSWTALYMTLQALGIPLTAIRSSSSPPVRLSMRTGPGYLLDGLKPNPLFYEMLMGWPMFWTAPGLSVTGFAAWLRRSRGQFSRLLTDFRPEG